MAKIEMEDLGMSYEAAAHGIQTVKAMELSSGDPNAISKFTPKHMRTGIDLTKAEMAGFAALLINKGVITLEEYQEAMRLGVNNELALEHKHYPGMRFM